MTGSYAWQCRTALRSIAHLPAAHTMSAPHATTRFARTAHLPAAYALAYGRPSNCCLLIRCRRTCHLFGPCATAAPHIAQQHTLSPAPRNPLQAPAFALQIVLAIQVLVFDFGVVAGPQAFRSRAAAPRTPSARAARALLSPPKTSGSCPGTYERAGPGPGIAVQKAEVNRESRKLTHGS